MNRNEFPSDDFYTDANNVPAFNMMGFMQQTNNMDNHNQYQVSQPTVTHVVDPNHVPSSNLSMGWTQQPHAFFVQQNDWNDDVPMTEIPPRVTQYCVAQQQQQQPGLPLPLPYPSMNQPVRRQVQRGAKRQRQRQHQATRPIMAATAIPAAAAAAPPPRKRSRARRRLTDAELQRLRPYAKLISQAADYLEHRAKCLKTQASKIKHAMYMLGLKHKLGKNPSDEDWEWELYRFIQINPQKEEDFILHPFNEVWAALDEQHPTRPDSKTKSYIQMRQAQINWLLSAYLVRLAADTSRCTHPAFRKIDVANRLSYLLSLGWKSGRGNATLLIPFNTWRQEGFRQVVNEYTEFDAKGKWDMFEVAKQCFVASEEGLEELEREFGADDTQKMDAFEMGTVDESVSSSFGGSWMSGVRNDGVAPGAAAGDMCGGMETDFGFGGHVAFPAQATPAECLDDAVLNMGGVDYAQGFY